MKLDNVINVDFRMKDNFSPTIFQTSKNIKGFSTEMKKTERTASAMAEKFKTSFEKIKVSGVKMGKEVAAKLGKAAIQTSLSEAFDMEGFRTQLEFATDDAKRAAQVMQYSIELAGKTPFDSSQMVVAASKLEELQLNTERWLPVLGDAATGVGRSMAEIQEGFAKAVTAGDFSELQDTLGVTQEMVDDFAKQKFGGSFLDTQGQVADTEKLQDALEGLLNERYAGSMEKTASTAKGLWENVTELTKNSLAEIVGMQSDGTIKEGSLFSILKENLSTLADTLARWQNDGTITKISEQFSDAFTKISDTIGAVFTFIENNKTILTLGATLITGAMAGLRFGKAVSAIVPMIGGVKTALSGMKIALKLTSSGWFMIGGAVVALAILIYKNFDTIKAYVVGFIEKVKKIFADIGAKILAVITAIWDAVKACCSAIKGVLTALFVGAIALAVSMVKGIMSFFSAIATTIATIVSGIYHTAKAIFTSICEAIKGFFGMVIDGAVGMVQKIQQSFSAIVEKIMTFVTDIWNGATAIFTGIAEVIKGFISTFIQSVQTGFTTAGENISNFVTSIYDNVKGFFSGIGEGISEFFSGIIEMAVGYIQNRFNFFIGIINSVTSHINKLSFTVPDWSPFGAGETIGFNIPQIPEFALGTQYAPGGFSRINERGGEIVHLPSGAKVIPADKSKQQLGGSITVNVTVQGNLIGNAEYAQHIGNIVGGKIVTALGAV